MKRVILSATAFLMTAGLATAQPPHILPYPYPQPYPTPYQPGYPTHYPQPFPGGVLQPNFPPHQHLSHKSCKVYDVKVRDCKCGRWELYGTYRTEDEARCAARELKRQGYKVDVDSRRV